MIKCECGKEFKDGRALHAHKKFHCTKGTGTGKKLCECKDGGDWEVLTKETPGGRDYIGVINPKTGKKYHKYCSVCKEVV